MWSNNWIIFTSGKNGLDIGFLSDLIAVEAVIFAFVIPQSINIVARVNERYQSDIVSDLFERGIPNRILPWLLSISLAIAVFLRFYSQEFSGTLLWKILSWGLLAGVLFSLILAMWLFLRMRQFTRNTMWITKKLANNAKRSIRKAV